MALDLDVGVEPWLEGGTGSWFILQPIKEITMIYKVTPYKEQITHEET